MPTRKTVLLVQVNLDPVPGAFHTPQSAMSHIQTILDSSIPHYEPEVKRLPFANH